MAAEKKDGSSTGFIRAEVKLTSMLKKQFESPPILINGQPWFLMVRRKGDHLAAYVYHDDANPSSLWSVQMDAIVMLHNANDAKSVLQELHVRLNRDDTNRGFGRLKRMDIIQDESKGYVKNDVIVVTAEITVSEVRGYRQAAAFDFTDASSPLFDVTLLIEGVKIHAGKQVLAMHSPVFHAMFFNDFKEKNEQEIELKDVKKEEFIELLHVIYKFGRKITAESVEFLLKLADQFQITFVLDRCESFLKDESKLSVIEKFKISDQYRLAHLQGHCLQSFKQIKDITKVESTEAYKALSATAKTDLLYRIMRISNS